MRQQRLTRALSRRDQVGLIKPTLIVVLCSGIFATGVYLSIAGTPGSREQDTATLEKAGATVETFEVDTAGIIGGQSIGVGGQLRINNTLVLNPSAQPANTSEGQVYFDADSKEIRYYDGTSFQGLASKSDVETLAGQIPTQQPAVPSPAQAVTNVIQQTTINNMYESTTGTVTETANNTFTGDNSFADITVEEFTASGSAALQGSLTVAGTTLLGPASASSLLLSSALGVSSGGTGRSSLASNEIVIGQGTGALATISNGVPGLCLMSTSGAPAFQTCPGGTGSAGVNSLAGLTGDLLIANSSTSGSTITIDAATSSSRGVASFNATNLVVTAGNVNTIQDIAVSAAPTFGGLTVNGAINGQTISSTANFTGTLSVGGVVTANTITPNGNMVIGANGQNLTLQGSTGTSLSANSGVNRTTLDFAAPTANVTYRLQAAAAGTYNVCTTAGNCTGINGGVTTTGGTSGALARFTGSQTLVDSILSESGSTITVNGSLAVNSITPTAALTVGSQAQSLVLQGDGSTRLSAQLGGITNSLLFSAPSGSNKSIVLPNASGTVVVSASGPLAIDANGNVTCASCTTSGGGSGGAVDSLNGINGAVILNDASVAGSTITINDASTVAKGIASFNSSNFSVTNGAVNTIQDISVNSAPTFSALTLSTPLAVASGGTGASTAAGARTNLGAAASGANMDITSLGGLSTALSVSQGGTGATNSQSAINTLSQLSTEGDLMYFNGTNSTRLGRGTSGQCLTSSTTSVAWSSCGPGEADTLATVTSRGATTNTGVFLQGGATTRGLTVDTATATDDTISVVVTGGGASRFTGQVTAEDLTANRTWTLPDASGTFCLQGSSSCGFLTGSASNYIQNQNASQQAASNFWVSGTGRADIALQAPSFDTATSTALNIGGTNASVLNLNQNTVIAASKSLTITGGATGTRPASPTEGMVYFDTTTKQLLTYANGKWQADRSTSSVIVAANDSRNKEGADYVVSTADETAGNADVTLQSAISSLPASGGTVYLMEGTYTVDTGILLPSKVTLAGAGSNSTILRLKSAHNGTINVIDSNSSTKSNIKIQDLRVDGNKANQTAGTQSGIYVSRVGDGTGAAATAGMVIRDVDIVNFRTYGLDVYDSENGRYENVRALGNTSSGIYIHWDVFHNVFDSVEASGNGAFGFRLDGGRYNKVTGSKFNSNGTGGARVEATNTSENSFEGNTAQSNTGYGFDIRYGLAGTYANNYISSNTAGGIRLENGINPSYTGALISGNTIMSNTGHGIEADRDVANATISSNRLYSNTGYGISLAGYLSVENPDNNAIVGNYVYSNALGGINLDQADDNVVEGNNVSENGGATTNNGIRLVGGNSTNNSINDNVITDASCTTNCYAILISSATGTTLSNNTLGNGTINDTGISTSYVNQVDANGNLINRGRSTLTVNTLTATSSFTLQGGMSNSQLPSPAAPTISRSGTSGSSTYGYRVTALDGTGETLPSTEGTITSGNATLSATNYNIVTWAPVPGAVQYKVYRTTTNGTPATTGLIATTTGGNVVTFNDTGIAATTAVPVSNTTGGLSIVSNIQGANATLTGGSLTLGTAAQQGSLVISDGSSNTATLQVANLAGNYTYTIPVTTANDTFCMLLTANCSGSGVSAIGALDGGTANANGATISGSTLYLQSASSSNPGVVNTGAQTFAGNKTFTGTLAVQDTTVGAGTSITFVGGITSSRPAAPAEGMVYFDTTTKQLITYSNGKWQADRSSNTKIVAASNSTQAAKDAADYVATGTNDQTQINAVLTAAAGGTVYLMEGTYTVGAAIVVPDNTTLSGAGRNTLIRLADIDVSANAIQDGGSGKVLIRDLRLDGQKSLNTAGTQNGIYLNGMGSTAPGPSVENVEVTNFRTNGIELDNTDNASINNVISNTNNVGVYVYPFSDWNTLNKVTAKSNVSHGVHFSNGSNNSLTNSISSSNGGYGLYTGDSYQVVESSTFMSNTSGGMRLNNDYHRIVDNVIRSNTGYGIYLDGSDIQINSNEINSNGNNGIYMNISSGGHKITNNTISSNTGNGINGSRNNNNINISGNYVKSNTAWGIELSGYIYQLISNDTVSNNTVVSNATGGIQLWSASSSSVVGNNVINNGGTTTNNGITIGNGYSGTNNVSNNTITDDSCTTNCYAISINGTDNQVTANTIGDGILVDFAGNNIYGRGEILDNGVNTIFVNQRDTNGNLLNKGGGGLSVNTSTVTSSLTLQGGLSNSQLPTPAQPKVANAGTAGTTTYGYRVTALDGTGETLPSTERTTTTGNAVLNATNYNVVTWAQVPGAVQYKVYRTTSAGTPATTGLIATVTGANNVFFNDTGIAAGVAAPGANTTGGATIAGAIQGSTASLSGALTVAGATTLNGTVTGTGIALFKNTANSATAFQIQDSSSVALFTADTSATKIVIRTLDVTYNLTIAGHIITGGSNPTIAANAAACTTPTVSVSGTDTAGSVTVTTGTGCAAPGDLATVTFATAFGAAPKVALTPASANAAALNAYLDDASLTTGSFRIGIVNTPTDATVYKWHYYALQ